MMETLIGPRKPVKKIAPFVSTLIWLDLIETMTQFFRSCRDTDQASNLGPASQY